MRLNTICPIRQKQGGVFLIQNNLISDFSKPHLINTFSKNPLTYSHSSCQGVLPIQFYNSRPPYTLCLCIRYRPCSFLVLSNYNTYIVK